MVVVLPEPAGAETSINLPGSEEFRMFQRLSRGTKFLFGSGGGIFILVAIICVLDADAEFGKLLP